jgi:hypothetical protein
VFRRLAINVFWRKWTNESEGKPAQKSDAASQQLLESISVFKEASRNFYIYFSLE